MQHAAREFVSLAKNKRFRWPFFYGLEEGRYLSWGGSKVFRTTHYPPFLKSLYVTLCEVLPSLACLTPDCLPTWYKTGKVRLTFHQDKSGEEFFGRRELVILLFAGSPRDLAIKHNHFYRTIHCTSQNTIILTPCANDIFWHAKLPVKSTTHSLTFAFRRGIPPVNTLRD